ncbi:putative lipid-transfer protein DIR1 [Nicotiana tomentosiformis]
MDMEHYLAKKPVALALVAILLSSFSIEVSRAQGICNISGEGLMSCKPSVTPPNPSAPTAKCCSALAHADWGCLCSYMNSHWLPSLGVDPTLAMQLPQKCKLPNPPHC